MTEGYDIRQFTDQASQTSRQEMSDDHFYPETSTSDYTGEDSYDLDEANTKSDEETSDFYPYYEASSSGEISGDSQYVEWDQIREYDLVENLPNLYKRYKKKQKVGPKSPKCDSRECMIRVSGNFALYLCYVCNLFLCGECMLKHDKTHEFVRVESETDERRRMAEMFVGRMRGERLGTGIDFDREDVRVHGRVNVKHELDEHDCFILGLSGMENKRWVAADRDNYCIKIFCSISNTLLRYIKFGSQPWGVTEMHVHLKSTDPLSTSESTIETSGAALDEPDNQCMLAVTFSDIKQIWFIDVNKTPAVKTKTIKIDKECWSIEFSQEKIFTLCKEDVEPESVSSICILSTEGNQLKVIEIPSSPAVYISDIAVHNGRVYFSDPYNERVLCISVKDGKTIFELKLERGFGPAGVSVDHNNGVLHLSGYETDRVHKLSPDLHEYEPLSLDTDYTEIPYRLCFMNNKLYISHNSLTSLSNVVTVVQLLT